MTQDTPNKNQNLKTFFVKLISIVLAIIITINILYNLILSERLEKIDRILLLNNDQYREIIKDKIRKELQDGLEKENMISVEDKKLLYKIYLKLKDEFKSLEKSQ
ncbi:hypothetical protein N9U84_03580 [Candidatus Pelagibacter sp.]|nr:hypothetical protein [Candidatus Pelagibacter sp.]